MKKIILIAIISICALSDCFPQDVITKNDGEDIQAKILEVNPTEIKYKWADNPEGPIFIISKSDVIMIRYENGTKEIFKEETGAQSSLSLPSKDLFIKGQTDAMRYYDGYTGAGTGTLIASLVSPLIGLIPAIACSSSNPKEVNLNYPDESLMKNTDYHNGYTLRAKKIKQGRVWTNWGIGFGANVIAYILLTSHR